jgi:hypothetical protein
MCGALTPSLLLIHGLVVRQTTSLYCLLAHCPEFEAYPLTLMECHRLRLFENGVLRRIFGPRRKGGMKAWRKLLNVEILNVYSSPNILRVIK